MPKLALTAFFTILAMQLLPSQLQFLFPQTAFAKIMITEVFPNPLGKDKNNEWIELYNSKNKNINLENWQIANNKTSKPLSQIIIPQKSFFILEKENLKIPLKNTNDQIKLFNPQKKLIDQVKYDNVKEGLSFSKIIIKGKNKNIWKWANPTKKTMNTILYEIKGEIYSKPENNTFYIIAENKKIKIIFAEKQNHLLLKAILKQGTIAKFLLKQSEKNSGKNQFSLIDFEIDTIETFAISSS